MDSRLMMKQERREKAIINMNEYNEKLAEYSKDNKVYLITSVVAFIMTCISLEIWRIQKYSEITSSTIAVDIVIGYIVALILYDGVYRKIRPKKPILKTTHNTLATIDESEESYNIRVAAHKYAKSVNTKISIIITLMLMILGETAVAGAKGTIVESIICMSFIVALAPILNSVLTTEIKPIKGNTSREYTQDIYNNSKIIIDKLNKQLSKIEIVTGACVVMIAAAIQGVRMEIIPQYVETMVMWVPIVYIAIKFIALIMYTDKLLEKRKN